VQFHAECGKANFYIDEITKSGRGYRATAFSLKDRFSAPYIPIPRETGFGRDPIAACKDAYRRSADAGVIADTHLEALFVDDRIPSAMGNSLSYTERNGNIHLTQEDEDLI